MTDPRALPPEVIAAIAERDTDDSIYGPFRNPFQRAARAGDDRRALLAHAAYLAERLAEAERDATASADVVGQLVEGTDHWSTLAADLTAQLARERADHAATVADHLAACEALLGEMRTYLRHQITFGDWVERIDDLLGPAPKKDT